MTKYLWAVCTISLLLGACTGPSVVEEAPLPTEAATTAPEPPPTTAVPVTTTMPESPLFPVTVKAANGEVTIEERPQRIISLSATATEILFAVGAGDQVLAVDSYSDYPPEAPTTDLSAFSPNVEAIAGLEPDLVIISFDPDGLAEALTGLGIPVILQGTAVTLSDSFSQMEVLGAATGNVAEAAIAVADIQRQIDEIAASITPSDAPLTYFHELGSELYSATSATFIGEIYGIFGLVNIADTEDPDGWGYPQLTTEHILDQDPDLIFLADTKCCGQSAFTVGERPGWDGLSAVKNGAVVELDDDIASRWGPRVVDYVQAVADAIAALQTADV